MIDRQLTAIKGAIRRKQLVSFRRPFEEGSVHGYALAVISHWLLLSLVSDGIRFNGLQCYRLRDIRRLRIPHSHAEFIETALKKRSECLPRKPAVSLASTGELLRSANRLFPLVTIHCEEVDPDVCWIGRVLNVDRRRVALLEISPDAHWGDGPTYFCLSEITRVDFGGDYEDALHIVGGSPPSQ